MPEHPTQFRLSPLALQQAMKELSGDTRFQLFMEQIAQMREAAIQDLCNDAVVGEHPKLAAAVGEIRCFNAIMSLVDHVPPAESQ